ncbi:phosphotransferase [Planococcus lenghuensis]|uniref:Aminoglycoside phosphotransferase domain-containing protein n=1 Tax=Planococcus lenghuensis TaxID=2213202 RepID=A0A1Q2L2B4_9BACL|nr:phosphotransferase [Planococcus lenghuensis]AQQ54579.1 hypothetical protein B0X71_16695 [Planococcus lenghuensis]
MAELKWNDRVRLEDVREWIASSIPDSRKVEGPITIFRSNDWGITASFHVYNGHSVQEVVCKIAFLPIFQSSPAIYTALSQLNSGAVPVYINGKTEDGLTWLLFEKFSGHLIREEANLNALIDIAKQMADLQKQFTPIANEHAIPYYSLRHLAVQLPVFVEHAKNVYRPQWTAQQEQLIKNNLDGKEDLLAICDAGILDRMASAMAELCGQLDGFSLPYSIDHLDLHSNNAIRTKGGEVIVFDFEEAVISCPLFSLEKLLDEAAEFENSYSGHKHKIQWSAAQLQLRDAYLLALDPNVRNDRLITMFDYMAAVAPIKYAYQSSYFLEQVGSQHMEAELMAESFVKAWKRIAQLELNKG